MPGEPKHFILATAGHVDHGKSALVKALTGTDPDRLPEEKARGITIDLGFAQLQLTAPGGEGAPFLLGIIDVPGHEDFVKNMVAGVGSVDVALIVVAADDGWMPQTEEHLQILSYLGVNRAVVALTKADLPADLAALRESVRAQLQGTAFADAPMVPTSVLSGAGLTELRAALAAVLAATPPPRDAGKPRLAIDRAFSLRGIGTIVTGTVSGGHFVRGQAVVLQPSGTPSRIRALQSHNQDADSVGPGTRAGFNLADVTVAEKNTTAAGGVARGQVVTIAEAWAASDTLDVLLERSARLVGSNCPGARPLKDGSPVRIHHGSVVAAGSVHFLEQKQLAAGERALAQIRLESPIFTLAGDRFVVRDWAGQATLSGGLVLDPSSRRRGFRKLRQRAFLQARAAAPNGVAAAVEAEMTRDQIKPAQGVLLQSCFGKWEVGNAMAELRDAGKLVTVADMVAEAGWWNSLRQAISAAVDAQHRAHPEEPGLPLTVVRGLIQEQTPLAGACDALLADLLRNGFTQTGSALRRAIHRPSLPPQLQSAGTALRAALARAPLDPPSRKELANTAAAQQALRFLIQTGEAVELGAEVILLAEAFDRAKQTVKRHLLAKRTATVSDLRQAVGTSRRIVVPLLERLDRDGITRREGDVRVLRAPQARILEP